MIGRLMARSVAVVSLALLASIVSYVVVPALADGLSTAGGATVTPPIDFGTWLLQVGPIGALVYGAILIGKTIGNGITVSVQVALPERETQLASRAVSALEKIAGNMPREPTP